MDLALIRALAAILDRLGGEAFVHDDDIREISPDWRVEIYREPAENGCYVRLHRPNDPVDIGAAKIIESRALPAPER